jgi:cytochrome c
MLTAALDSKMWVAYSTAQCTIYKGWHGDVDFNGAVYTGEHGPQPKVRGTAYLEQALESPWLIVKDGKEIQPKAQYKGHTLKNGQVTLKYVLEYEKGKSLIIEETPEYIESSDKDKSPGLERTYQTKDVPQGITIKLKTTIENITSGDKYRTTGKLEIIKKYDKNVKIKHDEHEVETHTPVIEGKLVLKSNDKTSLIIFFDENIARISPHKEQIAEVNVEGMFEKVGCYACHNPKQKTVGPAYIDIAFKYKNNEPTIEYLTGKVIKGGSGNWGNVMMNPHPDLPKADARKMVEYILAMNEDNKPKEKPKTTTPKNAGFAFNVYQITEDSKGIPAAPKDKAPFKSFQRHYTYIEMGELLPVENNFLVIGKSELTITDKRNLLLKLYTPGGAARVTVNGKILLEDKDLQVKGKDKQAEITLEPGKYDFKVEYYRHQFAEPVGFSSAAFYMGIFDEGRKDFTADFPAGMLSFKEADVAAKTQEPAPTYTYTGQKIPGDGIPLESVHPSFDLSQARPKDFKPRVAGLDFFKDGRAVISTWDSLGAVYILDNLKQNDPEKITYKRIATGLAEPLGLKVVNDQIYVLQKQELTKLIDHDGDQITDEYETICNGWTVSGNFHEFAFGLAYKEGFFYFALAIGIEPGGKSSNPQMPDRGKVIKVSKKDGSFELLAHGLRTPNGIGVGVDGELFIADNQGDWLPSCKIVHVKKGAFYGSRAVDFKGTEGLTETQPVVWLPQDEIGNSPSQPLYIDKGVYKGQMMHGEITHGGIKRVFAEKVNGAYQGVVFRFIQGLEAGVNRLAWSPDGQLYVGEIGVSGNWGHMTKNGMGKFGLQRLKFNGKTTFEMLAIRAKTNGIEIEFTEPLRKGDGLNPKDYLIKQWWYKPTENYGGPKMDEETLQIKSANVSTDRKKVFLEIDGIKEKHLIYVRLLNHFISTGNQAIWTTEAWYTMNQIPQNNLGQITGEKPETVADNELSNREKAEGWKLLFDGKSTTGWHKYNAEGIGAAWKVQQGTLVLDGVKNKDGNITDGGDIITDEEYENFELQIEWKISEAGNSGILFNVVADKKYDYIWLTGPEMQVLDDARHPDSRYVKHRAGDLYDMISAQFIAVKPAGEWNKARLLIKNGKVQHWLNGHKIVEYTMFTEEWKKLIAGSKFKDMPDFGKAKKGHIALQDHNDKVWYKNIKIRKL